MAVARFRNGAEAGYFADELTRTTGIETEILVRERFDGVHAVWAIDYVLLVAREEAPRAAEELRSLVESTSDEESGSSEGGARSDLPVGVWVPLILTLAAGSIACFGIERAERRPKPPALVVRDPRDPPAELWRHLNSSSGPWIQGAGDGTPPRRLTLDRASHTVLVEEDTDRDGKFDRQRRFSWPD